MSGSTLNLDYVRADEIAGCLEKLGGHVLGVVSFGAVKRHPALPASTLWVDIPVLGEYASCYEVWSSGQPVTPCNSANVNGAADGELLFGSLQLEQQPGDSLETLAARAYTAIFDFTERQDYPYLWRVWHYFPQINDPEQGLERYRSFNVGRHEAFVASGRGVTEDSVPAASALGSNSGPLVIYFLAGKQPGKPIENPRQVRAYHYPSQFGPRSPSFARAMLVTLGRQQCFIISGTASVVGYETLHTGDVQAQTQETLRNIQALLQQMPAATGAGKMLLKVYLRNAEDLPQVREQVQGEFAKCRAVYLQSNICRSDLLIEIEGICFNDAQS
jgi:chorismate lyase / 3-hydroxybenzoate synthase